jgi:branched-chain amino acid transport system substrate-binding protein
MRKLFGISMAVLASVMLVASGAMAAGGTIKIGVQAPITGKYANEGQGIDQSVRLLAEQYNAKGGVLGKKIEVVTCDDEGTAMKAAICAKDLVNKGVLAVIGSYTSTCAEAAEPTYYRAGVLQTSDGTADSLTQHGYWTFFRNSFPNSAEADFTAEYLVKHKKYKRIAILSDFSTYSDGLGTAVEKAVKAAGGNVIYRGKIQSGSQNFTPVLTDIKSMHPDVIYFSGYYTDGGLLRAQQVQLGIRAAFVGGDSNDNPDYLKLAGKYAAGSYIINVPTPEMLPYPLAKDFLKAYKAKYHMMPPSIWTLLNADGMRAILYAMEQNGSTDTKKAAEYLHNTLKDYPGITGPITFAKNGDRTGSLYMAYLVQPNGSYQIVYRQK